MNEKFIRSIKKLAITIVFLFVSTVLIREALIFTRFIKNSDDRKFDEILFSQLGIDKPIKVSDIYGEDWSEVCVLYPYDDPNLDNSVIPYRKQLLEDHYFSGLIGIGIPPLLLKNDDRIWWVFFVDYENKVKKLIRSQGRLQLSPPSGSDMTINIDGNIYSAVDVKKKCANRDKAFFVQKTFNYPSVKYLVFYEKE